MSQPAEMPSSRNTWWEHAGTLPQIAVFVVISAGAWFMLKELAVLLRPLLLAILLCYVIMPMHFRLRRDRSELTTVTIMTCWAFALLIGLSMLVYGNLIAMNEQLPRLTRRFQELTSATQNWNNAHLPAWLNQELGDLLLLEAKGEQLLQSGGKEIARYMADVFLEAVVVGLYALFLLVEARRFQRRVQGGFESERATRILATVRTINASIANYLKAKVMSSLLLALPATVVLICFGVHFAILWGLLTFLCNFIPYVGSLIGCGTPVLFGFLDLPPGWEPALLALVLIGCHAASASLIEPLLIGNAVGISPLVILMSLTFWGLCWGLVGMFLAVPLTVTLKIVLANMETTRPIAALLGDD